MSTPPVAGVTAVRALDVAGPLLGRRVLVTGASAGAGASPCSWPSSRCPRERRDRRSGRQGRHRSPAADQAPHELSSEGEKFDVILESVGGETLAAALGRVAPWGTIVSFGNSSSEPTSFDVSSFYPLPGARLYGMRVFDELDRHGSGVRDLTLLAAALADGRLDPQIGLMRSLGASDKVKR